MRRLPLVLLAVGFACTTRNPQYCDEELACEGGRVCDLAAHTCRTPDAAPPPECTDGGVACPGERPFCVGGKCVECEGSGDCGAAAEPVCDQGACRACAAEAECAARLATPHCGPDGACVACAASSHCTDALQPVCDEAAFTCRGCRRDAECAEVCDDATGRCVPENEILFVDVSAATPGSDCTKSAPCTKIADAVGRISDGRDLIRVLPGTYPESVTLDGVTVKIVGPTAAVVQAPSNKPAFWVTNGADASIRGLRLYGGGGDLNADGLRCSGSLGTLPKVALTAVTIDGNAAQGIDASFCDVTVERCKVAGNRGGGVKLTDCDYTLRNSFVTGNGDAAGAGSAFGGVTIRNDTPPARAVFDFNTVAKNVAGELVATAGVWCTSTVKLAASNSIAHLNGSGPPWGAQVSGTCDWTYSSVGGTLPAGTGNIADAPAFKDTGAGQDFHLTAGSAGIDAADPATSVKIDYDGETRPGGSRADMGADEAR